MNDQIIKSNGDNALASWGDREQVMALSKRLQATLPGGSKLDQTQALTLAQVALAHDLDPFNGECWMIPGSGVMVGIKGLRKEARKQAKREGSDFWTSFKPVEASKYSGKADDVVYECHLRDTASFQAWSKAYIALKATGAPQEFIENAIGPAPVTIGIGIANPGEKSKMELHARARKRAEADAIKQRFDVEFRGATTTTDYQPEIEPVDFIDTTSREVRAEGEVMAELGFGDEKPTSPAADLDTVAKAVVDAGLSENIHAARNALRNYCPDCSTTEKAVAWMRQYRAAKDEGKSTVEAAAVANGATVQGKLL